MCVCVCVCVCKENPAGLSVTFGATTRCSDSRSPDDMGTVSFDVDGRTLIPPNVFTAGTSYDNPHRVHPTGAAEVPLTRVHLTGCAVVFQTGRMT